MNFEEGDFVVRLVFGLMYFFCACLEWWSCAIIFQQIDSTCIYGHEVSEEVRLFMTIGFAPLIPDFVFALLGLCLWKLYNATLGATYNIFFGLILSYNGCLLATAVTCCRNPAMDFVLGGAIMGVAAGSIHVTIGVATHFMVDDNDGYYLSRDAEGKWA